MASSSQQIDPALLWSLRLLLPLVILGASFFAYRAIVEARKKPERQARPAQLQVIEAQTLKLEDYPIQLTSQGTVGPAAEAELSAEVSGRIVWVSDEFREGKIVTAGTELVRIEQADYQAQVILAEAEVARVQASLEEEQARAERALSEWQRVRGNTSPPPLAIREPQLKQAQAAVKAAQASLGQAQRDLERTTIRAPWDGFVRTKAVDVGQFVNRGESLGELFTSNLSEVWLPLTQRQLSLLDQEKIGGKDPLSVELSSREQGVLINSTGKAMRLSAELDEDTRQQFLIVEVEHQENAPRLRPNAFVEASFAGISLTDVFVLHPIAVRESLKPEVPLPPGADSGKVYLIKQEQQKTAEQENEHAHKQEQEKRLYSRQVALLWRTPEEVVVRPIAKDEANLLKQGDQISITNLQRIPEGQPVRVREPKASVSAKKQQALPTGE